MSDASQMWLDDHSDEKIEMPFHRKDGKPIKLSKEEKVLVKGLNDLVRSAGIEVVTDVKEGQKALEESGGDVRKMAGAKVETAKGIRLLDEEYYGVSSALMTQGNTYFHVNEIKDSGNVVKKNLFYGNNAYLWSSENGYEFFIEKETTD